MLSGRPLPQCSVEPYDTSHVCKMCNLPRRLVRRPGGGAEGAGLGGRAEGPPGGAPGDFACEFIDSCVKLNVVFGKLLFVGELTLCVSSCKGKSLVKLSKRY